MICFLFVQAPEIKSNILRFSGFVWHENEVIILSNCEFFFYQPLSVKFGSYNIQPNSYNKAE